MRIWLLLNWQICFSEANFTMDLTLNVMIIIGYDWNIG